MRQINFGEGAGAFRRQAHAAGRAVDQRHPDAGVDLGEASIHQACTFASAELGQAIAAQFEEGA